MTEVRSFGRKKWSVSNRKIARLFGQSLVRSVHPRRSQFCWGILGAGSNRDRQQDCPSRWRRERNWGVRKPSPRSPGVLRRAPTAVVSLQKARPKHAPRPPFFGGLQRCVDPHGANRRFREHKTGVFQAPITRGYSGWGFAGPVTDFNTSLSLSTRASLEYIRLRALVLTLEFRFSTLWPLAPTIQPFRPCQLDIECGQAQTHSVLMIRRVLHVIPQRRPPVWKNRSRSSIRDADARKRVLGGDRNVRSWRAKILRPEIAFAKRVVRAKD